MHPIVSKIKGSVKIEVAQKSKDFQVMLRRGEADIRLRKLKSADIFALSKSKHKDSGHYLSGQSGLTDNVQIFLLLSNELCCFQ